VTSIDNLPTPSQAYWNRRHELAQFRPRMEALQRAVGRLTDLTSFQWAQLFVMALEFRPDLILELGRGTGNSTCVFTEAANVLGSCRIVSMDVENSWHEVTESKVREIVPASWFEPLNALQVDILKFDYESLFRDTNRVLIFWDAHGFDVAECVLGKILPIVQNQSHLLIMHDLCDARYIPETIAAAYDDYHLWKGSNAELIFMRLGPLVSAVAQAISAVDFTSRNGLTLHSADHDLQNGLGRSADQLAELRALLGDELFSLRAWWHWLSLNEKPGPYKFPKYDYYKIVEKHRIEEEMRAVYEFEKQASQTHVTVKLRLKLAAKILLNRYPKEFTKGILWDVINS
jgi:hypothetical protein